MTARIDGVIQNTIVGVDGTKEADVTTSDGKNRLAVDAFVSNTSSNPVPVTMGRFKPRMFQDIISRSINAGDTYTVLDISGNGQIDFINVHHDNKKCEVILEVDGVEIYRINLEVLSSLHKLTEQTDWIHTDASAEFQEMYPTPVDFTTGFKIKIKNIDTNTKPIKSSLVRYRLVI